MSEGTDYRWEPVGAESLEQAVTLAVGAASMCWENMGGTGLYNGEQALGIVDGLVAWITGPLPELPSRTLEQDLAAVLNKHSAENVSDTPDFILAGALIAVLNTLDWAILRRGTWYGHHCSVDGGCSHE